MAWRDVYNPAVHNISCGQGQELNWLIEKNASFMEGFVLGKQICELYSGLQGNVCVNHRYPSKSRDQWCYVSSECQHLGGGRLVPGTSGISWKLCQDGVDSTLRSMQPEEIQDLAVQSNVDAGLMLKMAFPIWPIHQEGNMNGIEWGYIKHRLMKSNSTDLNEVLLHRADAALATLVAIGEPWIFDSGNGYPPYGLIYGSTAYETRLTDFFHNNEGWNPVAIELNKGLMINITCVMGCDSESD
jgi:hypothetical protein